MTTFIFGQFERTLTGRLHRLYFQFKKQMTYKKVKNLLNDHSISFPPGGIRGNSDQNKDYSIKTYNQCKSHSKCKCDFFDLDKMCELCVRACFAIFAKFIQDLNSRPF